MTDALCAMFLHSHIITRDEWKTANGFEHWNEKLKLCDLLTI